MKIITPVWTTVVLAICLLAPLNSCTNLAKNKYVTYGAYWWSGNLYYYGENDFDQFLPWLKKNKIEKIYYKLYDVDWNEAQGIYPADGPYEANADKMVTLYHQFIPCVFITNKVFQHATGPELEELAARLANKIIENIKQNTPTDQVNENTKQKEYQIDCDWTAKTSKNYFYLLSLLKNRLPDFTLSVTLRLYQYKYSNKTGIPPADKAALMLYNFNSPKKYSERNSIFDADEAKQYITNKKYPLPLDFILPSFGWSVIYDDKEFVGLLRHFKVESGAAYTKKIDDYLYECITDTVIEDFYLRKGNKIKVEFIDGDLLKQSAKLVDNFKNTDEYTLSVFSISNNTKNMINDELAKEIFITAH